MTQPLPSSPVRPTFDLEVLRTFVAVASSGTFAEAGAVLGRTQSSISQQMQRLEAVAGGALFQKEGRNKQLTEHGRQLLRYARDLLLLNDDAIHALHEKGDGGTLRLGSPHDVAGTLLPQVLGRLSRFMPQLHVDITIGRSPHLMEGLRRGALDITISTRQDPLLEGFALRASPTVWLCASQLALSASQPVPLILGDESSIFRRYALEALERVDLPWRQACSSSSPMGIKAALQAGMGVTARSLEFMGADVKLLGERDGFPALPDITYFLWTRPNALNPAISQAFTLLKSLRDFSLNPSQGA